MNPNVLSVLTDAIYISGIVGQEFTTPSTVEQNNALIILNALLSQKNIDHALIPFYQPSFFTVSPGVENYFIANLMQVDTLTFLLDPSLRLPLRFVPRDAYDGVSRANNVPSLPFIYTTERGLNGTNIKMYYFPDQSYVFTIWGKFGLSSVGLYDNLNTTYEQNYIEYLKVATANGLCLYYNVEPNPYIEQQLKKYETLFSQQISPPDLSVSGINPFSSYVWPNWGLINIGNQGWLPI